MNTEREGMSGPRPLTSDTLNAIEDIFDLSSSNNTPSSSGNLLYEAFTKVAQASNISLCPDLLIQPTITVEKLTSLVPCRYRNVTLGNQWWTKDNGPLLAFFKDSQEPCALLQQQEGYLLFNPSDGSYTQVTAAIAETLDYKACYFYRTWLQEQVTLRYLASFIFKGSKKDILRILSLEFITGLLALLIPVATSSLFASAIPNADFSELWQWILGLCTVSAVISLFHISRTIAETRFRLRTDLCLQSALWDKVLRLPVQFFRDFSAGDLSTRISAIDQIQRGITTAVFENIINAVFTILPLSLMCYYSPLLSLISTLMLLIFISIYLFFIKLQYRFTKEMYHLTGLSTSIIQQGINSICKIRTSGAEEHFFSHWMKYITDNMRFTVKSKFASAYIATLDAGFPLLITILIYFLTMRRQNTLSFADFIGFNAAFAMFSAALLRTAVSVSSILFALPLYRRMVPILESKPEYATQSNTPLQVSGQVDLEQVSFHYEAGTSLLKNISFSVTPGSFIAIVGPSGCGKSTLLRLLLGFEHPSEGRILYDGVDMSTLDLRQLRQHMGIVLQNDVLLPGSIFENIHCASQISLERAWELVNLVHLEDEIKAMPMGINTLVMEGGKTFSSGQRQRLIIARALASNPHILLLDEATSALDNTTQSIINNRLKEQNITRIVIAQRLNCIREADCIYVIDNGSIVESGTYDSLRQEGGLFAEMLREQDISSSQSKIQ